MNKTLLVLKNEIIALVSRRSFWLSTLGIPLISTLLFVVVGAIRKDASASEAVSQAFTGPAEMRPEGYVDWSGVITGIPASIPPGSLVAYPDEETALQALEAGQISAYTIIPADYISSGEIIYVRPDFNPLSETGGRSSQLLWVLKVNLAGGDELLASLLSGPLELEDVSLAPPGSDGPDWENPIEMWTPYAVTLLFYFLIMGSASLLLSNISKEKENRIVEVLLTSVSPTQLLSGKIIGLGLVGLFQTVLWVGIGTLLLNRSSQAFQLVSMIHLPASFLLWGLVFFILGYAAYASLMAGLGALAPNLREATQVTFVIMIPLIIPLFFSSSVFMRDPNGPIAVGLSLFPLSAPVAMMARLSAGGVPAWHPWLAAGLLALTAVIIVRSVAGMFRAQALLSGQPINIKAYFQALFNKP